jgi:hypothetical protein
VENAANVAASIGADELNYSLETSGDVSGSAQGLDTALGGGHSHLVTLNTNSLGLKTGAITISSGSLGVENKIVTLPIEFEVLPHPVAGDYNGNGLVDAADYTVWRNTVGLTTDFRADGTGPSGTPDNVVDRLDYNFWKLHYGEGPGTGADVTQHDTVPEPMSLVFAFLAANCLAVRARSSFPL